MSTLARKDEVEWIASAVWSLLVLRLCIRNWVTCENFKISLSNMYSMERNDAGCFELANREFQLRRVKHS